VTAVEQDTINCEYLAYFEGKKSEKNSKKKVIKGILCNFFRVTSLEHLSLAEFSDE
jgi:hypothetical protein